MPPIGPIKRRKLIRYLRQLGWQGPISGGRHDHMINGSRTLIIPNPHNGDLDRIMLLDLLQQAGISRTTWEGL